MSNKTWQNRRTRPHMSLWGLVRFTILPVGFDESIPSPEAQLLTLWDGSVRERLEPLESWP